MPISEGNRSGQLLESPVEFVPRPRQRATTKPAELLLFYLGADTQCYLWLTGYEYFTYCCPLHSTRTRDILMKTQLLMILLTLASIVVLALVAATVMLIRTMGSGKQSLPVTAEWISDLSTDHYKPMLRLLDSADIEFLRGQPGYTREMESKLRAQRCQVFRGYLRSLTSDFQRVCMALKIVMVQSERTGLISPAS
jgi:hypothetical protein